MFVNFQFVLVKHERGVYCVLIDALFSLLVQCPFFIVSVFLVGYIEPLTWKGALHPHPGMGVPSDPSGHGASSPGEPCSPRGPRSPFFPFFPTKPCNNKVKSHFYRQVFSCNLYLKNSMLYQVSFGAFLALFTLFRKQSKSQIHKGAVDQLTWGITCLFELEEAKTSIQKPRRSTTCTVAMCYALFGIL